MNIIAIAGAAGSGKDTAGTIIQRIIYYKKKEMWEVKKFAGKLKIMASMLTGYPLHYFEDQEFKKSEMDTEWDYNFELIQHDDNKIIGRGPVVLEDRRKKYTYREFLERLGTEALRNGIHQDVWLNALYANYSEESKWIITDLRFPNEYESIKKRGGLLLKINRNVEEVTSHISANSLEGFEFNYTIDNNEDIGKLELQLQDILILEKII